MTDKKITTLILFSFAILLASCKTYHITTQSLLEQLATATEEEKINVIIAFPLFFPGTVRGNSLKQIRVFDKKEKEFVLPVTNHTGVRITKKDGKRKTFYFDTLIIQDSTITGKNDHFIGIGIKPINLNNIVKIELQR